jgi:multiple sugar transport system permease protein
MSFGKLMAVLVLLCWSLVPIMLIVSSSLKPAREIFAVPPRLLFTPTLAHYGELWSQWSVFFKGLLNSLVITAGATLLAVAASLAAGFAYSRRRTRGLAHTAALLVGLRLIPPIVITLPLFPIVNRLGLADTHLVLILLYATFFVSMGSLLMRGFIDQIPRELDDAAVVDGAGLITLLRRVIVPLAVPGMLAVAVFVIVYAWNEFLFAFIFTSTRAKTAPLVLSEMISPAEGVEWGVLFAASTVQLLPVLVFVLLMQRHFVAGLTAGAVKG